jgi:hypothetical protein
MKNEKNLVAALHAVPWATAGRRYKFVFKTSLVSLFCTGKSLTLGDVLSAASNFHTVEGKP